MHVTGIGRVTEADPRDKNDKRITWLSVDAVNGIPLKRSVMVDFAGQSGAQNDYSGEKIWIDEPKVGQRCEYYMFECGAFSGIPSVSKGLDYPTPAAQGDGFHYRHKYIVLRSGRYINKGLEFAPGGPISVPFP